jgi:FimV-like protein
VAEQPTWRGYKGGDSYGPIASNERLWDIAAKVRPDPAISKEHMLKALFKANPQAFSKPNNINSLKVGATLRIPTLQEIVDYTGSKAANQLLEQQRTAKTPPASEPSPAAPEPVAPPAPAAEAPPALEPVGPPAPPAEALPALEPVGPPAPAEAPLASEPAPAVPEPASEPAPPAPAAEALPAPAETPPVR